MIAIVIGVYELSQGARMTFFSDTIKMREGQRGLEEDGGGWHILVVHPGGGDLMHALRALWRLYTGRKRDILCPSISLVTYH